MARISSRICGLLLLVMVGCGPSAPAAPQTGGGVSESLAPATRKTITVSARSSAKGFSPWLVGTTGGGGRSLYETHTNGLVSTDNQGNYEGRLAAELPSAERGTLVVLPDGRMQTTMKLRPNVKWHDGAPFTAADIAFSYDIQSHPEIPSGSSTVLNRVEKVEALDPLTVLITWKTTYFQYFDLDYTALWPFPRHLLGDAFAGDKEVFLNLPYWTTEYVQLGPFRMVDFGLGENLVLERFDDYFLGRPKVDRIIIRIVADENTVLANLKSGAIDFTTESTISADAGASLRDEWQRTGEGIVLAHPSVWFFANIQHNADYQKTSELRTDVRTRRGLLLAIDRDAIREVMFPGFPDTEGDSFMLKSDPRAPLVGVPFARYRFDPGQAAQLVAEAGWRRGPDGKAIGPSGEPVQINLRSGSGSVKEISVIAQGWRQLGLDVVEEVIPGSLLADRPYRATFPGIELTAQGSGDSILNRLDGRQCPRPPRFSGSQGGCYTNPELDRLIDRLAGSLDLQQQGLALKEIGELMADDLPVLPLYFSVTLAGVHQGIHALQDDFAGTGTGTGTASRHAYLWDRD